MIDQTKRRTIKTLGVLGVSTAAIAGSAGALAHRLFPGRSSSKFSSNATNASAAEIRVHTRVSAETNDLEVVVTNISWAPTKVEAFVPAQIRTRRGTFDLSELVQNGPLELAAGKSAVVPMKRHRVVLDGTGIDDRRASLSDSLNESMQVYTQGRKPVPSQVLGHLHYA
ncbi:MAG: hypothetical protein KTR35_12245 [Gammaproteobacteria bacterium]|nr:hypothetical protein [Gammaproteobacteria bacterium]